MRDLPDIDADLNTERVMLRVERRQGEHTQATADVRRRMDALLDERQAATQ